MSPEGRKSQPIFEPNRQTKVLGDRLLKQKGTAEEKIDGLTEAVVMILEAVDTLTQQGSWTNIRIDELKNDFSDLDTKMDSITDKMEEIYAKRIIKYVIGFIGTVLGGIGLTWLLKIIFGR